MQTPSAVRCPTPLLAAPDTRPPARTCPDAFAGRGRTAGGVAALPCLRGIALLGVPDRGSLFPGLKARVSGSRGRISEMREDLNVLQDYKAYC